MAERTLNCCRHGKRANQECYECASGFDNASPYIEEIRTALDDLARAEADEGIYDRVPTTTFGSLAGQSAGNRQGIEGRKTIPERVFLPDSEPAN